MARTIRGAAVAAKNQMHSQRTPMQARSRRSSLAQAPWSAHLPSGVIAVRFAGMGLCLLIRSFQSVRGAAATRKAVPAFTAGSGGGVITACSGSSRWRFNRQAFNLSSLRHQLGSSRAVRPNPSLERTCTGMALGPRGSSGHHPPRGPSATPAPASQLKR